MREWIRIDISKASLYIEIETMEKELVLVTGASGFTGGYVVREFLRAGKRVRAMVRSKEKGKDLESAGAEVITADLGEPESLRAAVRGVDGIVHIAAIFRQAGLPEGEFFRVNVEGTRALLDYSVQFGVKRFIHCSTVGVHGDVENPPGDEFSPFKPGDVYQRSKLEGELLVQKYLERGDLRGIIIRPAMIYGPHDVRTRKIFSMIGRRRFFYVGRGDKLVHFVDVRDLARAFLMAFDREDLSVRTFIVAGKEAMPLHELVRRIALILNVPEPVVHLPVRPVQALGSLCEAVCTPLRIPPPLYRRRVDFFTKTRCFNSERARHELGFVPLKGSFDELVDIVNSYAEDGILNSSILSLPCRIARTPGGLIRSWDTQAEKCYGWPAPSALGKISHELFHTEFPAPLKSIESRVHDRGEWIGNLRHMTSAGNLISVLSRWSMHEVNGGGMIEEENRVRIASRNLDGHYSHGMFAAIVCNDLFMDLMPLSVEGEMMIRAGGA